MKNFFYFLCFLIFLPDKGNSQIEIPLDICLDRNTISADKIDTMGNIISGTDFFIQGILYPDSTFILHGPNSGMLPDGSPEFPDLVIGSFWSYGWMVQPEDATTGVKWITKHFFTLEKEYMGFTTATFVTHGAERAEWDTVFSRAIIGSTGSLKFYRGEENQTNIGINQSGDRNISSNIILTDLRDIFVATPELEEDLLPFNFSMSPNPASDLLFLKLKNQKGAFQGNIIISNLAGQQLISLKQIIPPNDSQIKININQLPPGSYFLTVIDEKNSSSNSRKFITIK